MTSVGRSVVVMMLAAASASSQDRFSFEVFLGSAHNFGTTLTLVQEGFDELSVDAAYETRAFELPPYYSWRLGFPDDSGRWELQFTHHKLHLADPPSEIQSFEITHGYNILAFGRAFSGLPVDVRVLGGIVIAHPDSEVRHEPFSPSYQLTGPSVIAGVGKRIDLSSRLYLGLDAQLLVARARVPIHRGEASAPNVSLHVMFGAGIRF